jgi:hypothetical protein
VPVTTDVACAHAGLLAAAGIVASKQIAVRNPPLPGPRQVRPSSLGDLARLFGREEKTVTGRVARLSAAALVYSANKDAVQAEKILREQELKVLRRIDRETQQHKETDRSCPHCRLLYGSLYEDQKRWRKLPPIAVVNHSARIDLQFDPETNTSQAAINRFQVVVPYAVVTEMLHLSHPMNWKDTPGGLFRKSDPVDATGGVFDTATNPAVVKEKWEKTARDAGFIFEDVVWPLNEDLRANSENIIRIANFQRIAGLLLSYDYSLQRSVRSNFGIAWESGGLDLDGGSFSARAFPLGQLSNVDNVSTAFPEKVMRRDVLSIEATHDPAAAGELYVGWSDGDPKTNPKYLPDLVERKEIVAALETLNLKLENTWPELQSFYLLTVNASKELHFTIPENSPIELWQTLTWMAPATLFMFLNQAVCLAPHVLLDNVVTKLAQPAVSTIGGPVYVN